ncbi:hypothetical protein [Chitinophaga defluvii]|uniref:FlgD-like protein n=1 Tax=Chitinophaga defluvii TaxID=3163343 RepID=A0ABV2T2T2_9BACT
MAFSITYRRLAAVNFLHNFYLDQGSTAFYDLSETDRTVRLESVVDAGRYSLMNDILLEPTPATAAQLRGHKIVWRQTAQGLVLGMAIRRVVTAGVERHVPVITPSAGLRLEFRIKVKKRYWNNRSNMRLQTVLPAAFYFTNDDTTTGKVYPSLSQPMQQFEEGRFYEMGELATVNGVSSRAITNTTTAMQGWAAWPEHYCISEQDRHLLPFSFRCRLDERNLQEAAFTLLQDGTVKKQIIMHSNDTLQEVTLDWNKDTNGNRLPNGWYTLTITAANGYNRIYQVLLHRELYQPDTLGIIDLAVQTEANGFSLLNPDGDLVQLPAPAVHPVFELRFLSRTAYWRYIFQEEDPGAPDAGWTKTTATGSKAVICRTDPFGMQQDFRKITYQGTVLPNPDGNLLIADAERIYADTMLTKIKL